MSQYNPFQPPEVVRPRIKALFYGREATGKTFAGLSAPGRIAVIDSEAGTVHYRGRPGLSEFHRLQTKSAADALAAIRWLEAHPGMYETVIVDPVTLIWDTLNASAQERRAQRTEDPDADLDFGSRARVGRHFKTLEANLINLPMHVIAIARESEIYETGKDGSAKVVGTKPDAHKSITYDFDVVLHFHRERGPRGEPGARLVTVDKDRTGALVEGTTYRLPDAAQQSPFMSLFGAYLATAVEGAVERRVQTDDEAAIRDAVAIWNATEMAGEAMEAEIIAALEAIGQDPAAVLGDKAPRWSAVEKSKAQKVLDRALAAKGATAPAAATPTDPSSASPNPEPTPAGAEASSTETSHPTDTTTDSPTSTDPGTPADSSGTSTDPSPGSTPTTSEPSSETPSVADGSSPETSSTSPAPQATARSRQRPPRTSTPPSPRATAEEVAPIFDAEVLDPSAPSPFGANA